MSDQDPPPRYSLVDNFDDDDQLSPLYSPMDNHSGSRPDLSHCPCSAVCFNYYNRFGVFCSDVDLTEEELMQHLSETFLTPEPQKNAGIEEAEAETKAKKTGRRNKLAALGKAITGVRALLVGLVKGLGKLREEPEMEESEESDLLYGRRTEDFEATRQPSDSELDFPPYYLLPALE